MKRTVQCKSKNNAIIVLGITLANVGRVSKCFTVRFSKEFAIKPRSRFLPHLTYVATLQCEM